MPGALRGVPARGGRGVFSIIAPSGPYGAMMENSRAGGDFPHPTQKQCILDSLNPTLELFVNMPYTVPKSDIKMRHCCRQIP